MDWEKRRRQHAGIWAVLEIVCDDGRLFLSGSSGRIIINNRLYVQED